MIRKDTARFGLMTPDEDRLAGSAIDRAEAKVRQMEIDAGPGGWIFPTELQRTAQAARATLEAIKGVRDGLKDAPDYDHETALKIVENANALSPELVKGAIIGQTVGDRLPSLEELLKTLKWIAIGSGALILLTIYAPEIKMGVRAASSGARAVSRVRRRKR